MCGVIVQRKVAASTAPARNLRHHQIGQGHNARARAFYEGIGYCADGAEKLEQTGGHPLYELRYRRSLDGA